MKTPLVIAHRGASGHAPENTMIAFQRAVELGSSFIETDLHVTRDGAFVAIHDDTVDRTTNGSGEVTDFTLEELRRADAGMWFDRDFLGERVPTLPEILEFAKLNDVIFYLELKYPAVAGMDHALAAALTKANATARTIVISFDAATLAPLRRIDPAIMVGLLIEDENPNCIQQALDLGARQICPKFSLVNAKLIEQAHRADLQVVAWTVNSADQMRSMIATGVDGIMTDFPDRLRAVIEDSSVKKEVQ
jgi:glycerophosphoryl diester phosphodiesterase